MSLVDTIRRRSAMLANGRASDLGMRQASSNPNVARFLDSRQQYRANSTSAQRPQVRSEPTTLYRAFGKRALDLLICLMVIPLVSIVVVVALIASFDGGSPFYRHQRIGRGGKKFGCLKVRTMRRGADEKLAAILNTDPEAAREWAEKQKLHDDPRITWIGHFLRKTSIDELPQIWNVLRGEMSLVGPRPVTETELERYGEFRAAYLSVVPGITGLWQIDPQRNEMSYAERVDLDCAYARSYNFIGDAKILMNTVVWAINPNGL